MGMSREERRRRIVERGSDRLALITGQLQNLDPSEPSSASHHRAQSESFMPSPMVSDDNFSQETVIPKYQFKEASTKTTEEPKLASVPQKPPNPQAPPKPGVPKPAETRRKPQHQINIFTSKKLNSSIIKSEGPRNFCSLIIAFLVVLSYMTGVNIAALRPVYVLLLTDCAIVVAHVLMEASGNEEGENVSRRSCGGGGGGENWEGAEKLLERGLLAYQVLRGIFIDCSLYMVVVICGVSLF